MRTTVFVLLMGLAASAPSKGQTVSPDSLTQAIEKERREADAWLKSSPSSYLAAVARTDFGDRGTLTVGRSPDNDVVLDQPFISEHQLTVTVVRDSFLVKAVDPQASFGVGGKQVRSAVVGPSALTVGRLRLRLSHQRFPAIIVFDPESPRFKEYHGLRYYPVDLAYRLILPLRANPKPDTVTILSTRGNRRRALRVGWFDFTITGSRQTLEADRLLEPGIGEESISVFFTDATTGAGTYSVGRYVDLESTGDGRYILDFNRAYNPACAFSPYYNCPIPPEKNHLSVAIRAGEMDPHGEGH